MKVAIIGAKGYPYVYGGYDTFVKELSERLVKKGVNVTVYCHKQLFTNRPKQVNGINLVYVNSIETKSLTQLVHSFLSIIHASFSKAEVILVLNVANGPYGIIPKITGKKTMINIDGVEWERPKWKGLGSHYFFFAARMATFLYDVLIADAAEMQKIYKNIFRKESTVIAYGANTRYSENPSLIQKWGLQPQEYYLIVGRLIPDNNADLIIEGFLQSVSSRKLVVIGDVPFKDAYANHLKNIRHPRVIFLGYITDQDELAELYHQCFIYFHGHEYGGTNPALLKALAYGCAVLALDNPFNRETLSGNTFGEYFKKNTYDICRQIRLLENNPGRLLQLRSQSRNAITGKYDWDVITDQYISVMKQLLPSKYNR